MRENNRVQFIEEIRRHPIDAPLHDVDSQSVWQTLDREIIGFVEHVFTGNAAERYEPLVASVLVDSTPERSGWRPHFWILVHLERQFMANPSLETCTRYMLAVNRAVEHLELITTPENDRMYLWEDLRDSYRRMKPHLTCLQP